MKLLHVSDLHLGKRVNGLSMAAEQRNVIDQIVSIAIEEGVAGVLVAGDVFDRPHPSRDALEACERLFSRLCDANIPVYVIPGNHDSATQLAFLAGLLSTAGLNIAKAFSGVIETHDLFDGEQRVRIHMLPFVRPTDVRMALPDRADDIRSHDDAVRVALSVDEIDPDAVNVLMAHQFATASGAEPETCDSEIVNVGGADNVDASAFDAYDYVALGHLHGAQHVGRPAVRYSGSPLKYSLSEIDHEKSATIVSIEAGRVEASTRALTPLHEMREVTASYDELVSGMDEGDHLDYMRVTLTDKSLFDAMAKVRAMYPNVLRLDWEHALSERQVPEEHSVDVQGADPLALFEDFFAEQTGEALDDDDREILTSAFEEARYEAPQA